MCFPCVHVSCNDDNDDNNDNDNDDEDDDENDDDDDDYNDEKCKSGEIASLSRPI